MGDVPDDALDLGTPRCVGSDAGAPMMLAWVRSRPVTRWIGCGRTQRYVALDVSAPSDVLHWMWARPVTCWIGCGGAQGMCWMQTGALGETLLRFGMRLVGGSNCGCVGLHVGAPGLCGQVTSFFYWGWELFDMQYQLATEIVYCACFAVRQF